MSSLALLLYDLWYQNLVCIDAVDSSLMQKIRDKWIKQVIIWHGKYKVQKEDIVIYSDIPSIAQGPEVTQSREYQQTPTQKHFHICITYNQFIAEISKRFLTISVAWSNGKTSTTGMLIYVLSGNQQFWLWVVWWLMPNFDQQWYCINTTVKEDIKHLFDHMFNQKHQLNYSLLKKYIFVIEACEYKEHFLLYDTDYALITNVERDHIDYFLTQESYTEAFKKFIHWTRYQVIIPEGTSIDHLEEDNKKIIPSSPFPFSTEYLVGKYHESNAGMVIKLMNLINLTPTPTNEVSLTNRKGMWRRMELLSTWENWSRIYTDYSHHAPAIHGNLEALKKQFPDHTITVIFQPHQAQRVLAGRNDFTQALKKADNVFIYKLYTAREDFQELQKNYPQLQGLSSFKELGEKFAQQVGGIYTEDINDSMKKPDEKTITVIFSAGDLDAVVRKELFGYTKNN